MKLENCLNKRRDACIGIRRSDGRNGISFYPISEKKIEKSQIFGVKKMCDSDYRQVIGIVSTLNEHVEHVETYISTISS